jgi:UDP-N-acetylmuramate: L-alanyl-gamma-D-glutamyl-meso-diaminopimelate ligase
MVFQPKGLDWSLEEDLPHADVYTSVDDMVLALRDLALPGDHILFMSNGGFEDIHIKLETALKEKSFS